MNMSRQYFRMRPHGTSLDKSLVEVHEDAFSASTKLGQKSYFKVNLFWW